MKFALIIHALLLFALLPARAETIDVYDNHGGRTHTFIWMSAPDVYQFCKKC